jgi:hypothetical protein
MTAGDARVLLSAHIVVAHAAIMPGYVHVYKRLLQFYPDRRVHVVADL